LNNVSPDVVPPLWSPGDIVQDSLGSSFEEAQIQRPTKEFSPPHNILFLTESENGWETFDYSRLSPQQQATFSPNIHELAQRVALIRSLYRSGALTEEAIELGIHPSWVDALQQEGVRTVVQEQLQPVPNLYSALGEYGTPADLVNGIKGLAKLRHDLESIVGEPVEAGYLASRHHGMSFSGITFGGYVTLPEIGSGRFQRLNFFTGRDKETFEHAGYGDLTCSPERLDEIGQAFEKLLAETNTRNNKEIKSAYKLATYIRQLEEIPLEVPQEKRERLQELTRNIQYLQQFHQATQLFVKDWEAAREHCKETPSISPRVPYLRFVEKLNELFISRVVPDLNFKTFYNDTIDNLPTIGVVDWPLFTSALLKGGILHRDEAICRFRVVEENGRVRYYNTWLADISDKAVTVSLRGYEKLGKKVDIRYLAELSKVSLENGKGPTLVPGGKLRYLANFAMSPSLILFDGMEFSATQRVFEAIQKPDFLKFPRFPTVHPYSKVCEYAPADPQNPWTGLREAHSTLDYYRALTALC
jgi:hypothetical protein